MTRRISVIAHEFCKCREDRLNLRWTPSPCRSTTFKRTVRAREAATPVREFHSSSDEKIFTRSDSRRKIVGIGWHSGFQPAISAHRGAHGMSVVQDRLDSPIRSDRAKPFSMAGDDPVSRGLRGSARRMAGIAVFSGVINLLMLSGSLYMLQVYDRVIPSRSIATLLGLSLMVLLAYLMQGYFDALRARMLCRVATLFDAGLQDSIHTALATLPLRGVKPMLMQQPLRDLDQIRAFMSGMGPTAFLDMPWIPIFLVALFLFHPLIGLVALLGTISIIAMTLLNERLSRGAARSAMDTSAQRQVLADATQRNAEVVRALGMTERFGVRWSEVNERYLRENIRTADLQANLGAGAKVLRYVL